MLLFYNLDQGGSDETILCRKGTVPIALRHLILNGFLSYCMLK